MSTQEKGIPEKQEQLPHSEIMQQKALEMTNEVKKQEAELEAAFKYFSETNIGQGKYSEENERDISFQHFGDKAQEALNTLREGREGENQLDPTMVAQKTKEMIDQIRAIIKRIKFKGTQEGTFDDSLFKHQEAKDFSKTLEEKVVALEAIYAPMATRLEARKDFKKFKDAKDGGTYYGGSNAIEIYSVKENTLSQNYAIIDHSNTPQKLIENLQKHVAREEADSAVGYPDKDGEVLPEERRIRLDTTLKATKEYLDEFEKLNEKAKEVKA